MISVRLYSNSIGIEISQAYYNFWENIFTPYMHCLLRLYINLVVFLYLTNVFILIYNMFILTKINDGFMLTKTS